MVSFEMMRQRTACIEAGLDLFFHGPGSVKYHARVLVHGTNQNGWVACAVGEAGVTFESIVSTETYSISSPISFFAHIDSSQRFGNEDEEEDGSKFPFETDPDDHCESPLQAYQDILPFLKSVGNQKLPKDVRIYDPYYCNGAVRRNLDSIGFPNVYNQKEDCYKVWSTPGRYPSFDILITNPPYSADHMEKLMQHITSPAFGNRPWMLLLPQFFHKKDCYSRATAHIQPFYLVPKKRYVYLPPPSFRQAKKSDVHKKSSPFVSMWYIWGGTAAQNERWLSVARKSCSNTCDVARSRSALRDLRRRGKK